MSSASPPSHPPSVGSPPRAGRREWLGLAVIALPCLLYSMDLTVMNLALPTISRALSPTNAQELWIVDSYGFLLAGSLVTMGTLGDRLGRRRVLLIGAAAFEVASIIAAFSSSATMLIVMRGLLGIAGATLAPSTLSLIRNLFLDARQRTFAVGIWATSFSVGAAIGPFVGGLLLQRFWWGSAFLIGAPVMILLLLLGPVLLPEFRAPDASRVDWPSAALSALGVLPLIYGLKRAAFSGIGVAPVLSMLVGVAVIFAFVRRQRSLAEPLLDLRLFAIPAFRLALALNSLSLFVAFSAFLFVAQYLQLVLGLSPLSAGLWTVPSAFGFIIGSLLAPWLARHFPLSRLLAASLAFAALGLSILCSVEPSSRVVVPMVAALILAIGVSPVVTLATDLIVSSAPAEVAGAASALSETSTEFGGAAGIAIFGSIGGAVYRWQLAKPSAPALAPSLASAGHQTLAFAISASERLAPELGVALRVRAR